MAGFRATLWRALALALILFAADASAHAFLESASPAAGSQLAIPPPRLTLRFTEGVEPVFCTIQLVSPSGAAVPLAAPARVENDRTLAVSLPRLTPGTWTVIWHVTSVDTHKTEGRYQFTIGP
jgi:methionine-rich copper-binding protein CopC